MQQTDLYYLRRLQADAREKAENSEDISERIRYLETVKTIEAKITALEKEVESDRSST